jgi:hypothetical protein
LVYIEFMPDSSSRRAVSPPVLIIEDKSVRGGEVLSEIESLGLHGRIVPTSSMYAVPGPTDRYSLAILSVRTLQPRELSNAAAVRRASPELPILLLCDEKTPVGISPLPNCMVMSSDGIGAKLRIHVADLIGISLSDAPGATLKE